MDDIPFFVILFGFISFCVYLDYRVKAIKAGSKSGDSELAKANTKLEAKAQDLEERVQVLESIVTDKKYQLKEKIDTL